MNKLVSILLVVLLSGSAIPAFAQMEDPGEGTFKDPFVMNHFGDSGDGILVRVTGAERTGDNVVVMVDVQCAASREVNCIVEPYDFELAGDGGIIYPNAADDDESAFDIAPGGEASGIVPALIDSSDSNIMLLFYHFATIPYTFPLVFATEAMPEAAEAIAINATIGMIARLGPSSDLDFSGVFNRGEQIMAHGRNADGTWLEIQFGWVRAKLVEAEGDIMSLPVTTR